MSRTLEVNGVTLELTRDRGLDTRVHHCAGCWFHENGLVCDEYIGVQSMGESAFDCGATNIFVEVE